LSNHSAVAHHFYTVEQQRESASIGMWLFLVTEILLFGALFAVYAIYRLKFPQAFLEASAKMDWELGTVNTVILAVSSVTMGLAVSAAKKGNRNGILAFLTLTAILGVVFLGVKGFEYSHHWSANDVPGAHFTWDAVGDLPAKGTPGLGREAQLFFFMYFFMTGTHAVHMVVGLGLLAWMWITSYQRKYSKDYYNPVEMTGLYWHFVDLVWTFLFPTLYLAGAHLATAGHH
jgi:cytochrome c oxidase subunit III